MKYYLDVFKSNPENDILFVKLWTFREEITYQKETFYGYQFTANVRTFVGFFPTTLWGKKMEFFLRYVLEICAICEPHIVPLYA